MGSQERTLPEVQQELKAMSVEENRRKAELKNALRGKEKAEESLRTHQQAT
jgi:hypothetical protein